MINPADSSTLPTEQDTPSLNGHNESFTQEQLSELAKRAQAFFMRIMHTDKYEITEGYPDLGPWTPHTIQVVDAYCDAYYEAGNNKVEGQKAASKKYRELVATDKELMRLMSARLHAIKPNPQAPITTPDISTMIPLPQELQYPPEMSKGACDWLDRYTAFSRKWSPRSYEPYHEACGLWIMSLTAGRRVRAKFGPNGTYTNLNILLAAKSSVNKKTTAIIVAKKTLAQAGLDWRFTEGLVTPQKFIYNRVGHVRSAYNSMSTEQQKAEEMRIAASAQLGWLFDEFGQHLSSLVQSNSLYHDFSRIFRKLDDCEDKLAGNDTLTRDEEILQNPYLALLAGMAFPDMKPIKKATEQLWGNGYFARFVMYAPPPRSDKHRERFIQGDVVVPSDILLPLVRWNKELGVPQAKITEITKGDNPTGEYEFVRDPLKVQTIDIPDDVMDAFYNYYDFFEDLIDEDRCPSLLAANYDRLAGMALRIALLFASFSNGGKLEMKHWAKAQTITECMRQSLHHLLAQINEPKVSEEAQVKEQNVIRVVGERGELTEREIAQFSHVDREDVKRILWDLVPDGVLEMKEAVASNGRKVKRYKLAKSQIA
jgi:Protein of unknown function (DUF3987)